MAASFTPIEARPAPVNTEGLVPWVRRNLFGNPASTVANHREGGESEDTTTFHNFRYPVYGYEFFLKAFRAIAHAVVCAHKFTRIRS